MKIVRLLLFPGKDHLGPVCRNIGIADAACRRIQKDLLGLFDLIPVCLQREQHQFGTRNEIRFGTHIGRSFVCGLLKQRLRIGIVRAAERLMMHHDEGGGVFHQIIEKIGAIQIRDWLIRCSEHLRGMVRDHRYDAQHRNRTQNTDPYFFLHVPPSSHCTRKTDATAAPVSAS